MSFAKLDSSITTSSLWSEDTATRVLFITMLALKDQNGFIHASEPGLIRAANITEEEFQVAIKKLESPDRFSRSPEYDGRRVERVTGGWIVLNNEKYRADESVRREQVRERVRKFREKQDLSDKSCNACNALPALQSVTSVTDPLQAVTRALPSVSVSESVSGSNQLPLSLLGGAGGWMSHLQSVIEAGPPEWMTVYQAGGIPVAREWEQVEAIPTRPTVEQVVSAARAFRSFCAANNRSGQYVKTPERWIREGGWRTDWTAMPKNNDKPGTIQGRNYKPL